MDSRDSTKTCSSLPCLGDTFAGSLPVGLAETGLGSLLVFLQHTRRPATPTQMQINRERKSTLGQAIMFCEKPFRNLKLWHPYNRFEVTFITFEAAEDAGVATSD